MTGVWVAFKATRPDETMWGEYADRVGTADRQDKEPARKTEKRQPGRAPPAEVWHHGSQEERRVARRPERPAT